MATMPTITLSASDRDWLNTLIRTGRRSAQEVRRSRILLELDTYTTAPIPASSLTDVAARVGCHPVTITRTLQAHTDHDHDVAATVTRKKRLTPPVESKVTGDVEARLIALATSTPPESYHRWSLRLLEKHVILTEGVPQLDHSTIGKVLKKTNFART